MKKVVFTQDIGVSRDHIDRLLSEHNLKVDWSLADGKLVEDKDSVVAISSAHIPLPKEMLGTFPNLKVVSMSFTGYDHVDKEYCLQNGVAVYNVPAYSTDSVAELALGLAISLLRQIPAGDSEMRSGNWNENLKGIEMAGKKCGIVGTGTIGCRLAEILKVFKCELLGWSKSEKQEFKDLGGIYKELNSLFSESDLIFLTVALNENTKNLVTKEHFNMMKPSAFIINVSRGPVINRDDLVAAVKNKTIAGVGLDVFDVEPLKTNDELRQLENAVLTPHIAYRTQEALERKAEVTIENIIRGLKNEPTNRVI